MKALPRSSVSRALVVVVTAVWAATGVRAQSVDKYSSGTDLAAAASWGAGAGPVPAASDVATWTSTSLGAGLTLATSAGWLGIDVQGAATAIGITGAGTLTLGASGITIAATGQNLTLGNGVTVGSSQAWNVGSGRTLTCSAAVTCSGALTLAKEGAGSVILTANSTGFTGVLAVNNGALQLGNNSTAGAVSAASVTIGSGGNLIVNRSNNTTLSYPISGAGTLTKQAAGEANMTYANSFSGTLDVQAGKLAASHIDALAGKPTLDIDAGAYFSLGTPFVGASGTVMALTGSGTVNPQYGATTGVRTLNVEPGANTTFAGVLADGGSSRYLALTKSGVGTLILGGAGNGVAYTGATTVNGGVLQVGGAESSIGLFELTGARTVDVNAGGTLRFVYRNSMGALGQTSATRVVVDGGTVTSSTGANGALTMLTDLTLRNGALLEVTKPFSTYGTYQLKGAVTVSGTSPSTIALGTGGTGWVCVGNGSDDTGITTFDVADVTGSSAADLTISTVIKDGVNNTMMGALTKAGLGTLALTAANTYSGGTTVNAGSITVSGSGTLGTGTVTVNGAGVVEWSVASGNKTVANKLDGAGSMGKTGAGALILDGANGFSGVYQVDAGNVVFHTATSEDGKPGLAVGASAQVTLAQAFAGGTATFSSLSGNGVVTINYEPATTPRTLQIDQAGDTTYSGSLLNANAGRILALHKAGAGTLTLTGTCTYTGATTISGGTLKVNSALDSGSPVTVKNLATLAGGGSVGAVTVESGGALSPGAGIGTLTCTALTLQDGARLVCTLGSPADKAIVGGELNIGAGTLGASDLDLTSALDFAPNQRYVLVDGATLHAGDSLDAADLRGQVDGLPVRLALDSANADLVLEVLSGQGTVVIVR